MGGTVRPASHTSSAMKIELNDQYSEEIIHKLELAKKATTVETKDRHIRFVLNRIANNLVK